MCIREEDLKEMHLSISNVIIKCIIPQYIVDDFYLDYGYFFENDVDGNDFCVLVKSNASDIVMEKASFITKMDNRCYISDHELIFLGSHLEDEDFYLNEFRKYFIAFLTLILYREKNMILLHSSAIEIDGKCILFAGNSGAGKTTMEMIMVKNGATYISNDLTFLYIEHNKVKVLGVPQKITMSKKTYDYCKLDYEIEKDKNRIHIKLENHIKTKATAELDGIILLSKDVDKNNTLLEKVDFNGAVARLVSKVIYPYKWGFKPLCKNKSFFSVMNGVLSCIKKTTSIYYLIWGNDHSNNYNAIMKQVVENEGRSK